MSALFASQRHALNAVTFQLVAGVQRYEQDLGELMRHWPDARLYDAVRQRMDDIQVLSSSVPCIAVPAAALLIAHSELIFMLWRSDPDGNAGLCELQRVRASHRDCVAALRRRCLRELARHAPAMRM